LKRVVIVIRRGGNADALKARIAMSDPTPASDMDGPAVIQALRLAQATVLGVIDMDEIALLLASGQVGAALLHGYWPDPATAGSVGAEYGQG
jgi:hypothetical protein